MEPTRQGSLLNMLFVNKEALLGDVTLGSHHRHTDHKIAEFTLTGEEGAQQNCHLGLWPVSETA